MFECPLTKSLTPQQIANAFWIGEDDHCLYLMKGYRQAETIASFTFNSPIEVIRSEAEDFLRKEHSGLDRALSF
jgi:hypothetical protein